MMAVPDLPLADDTRTCCTPLAGDDLEPAQVRALADAFKALGDPVRLRILNLILNAPGREVCACDLVTPLGRSQPTVSHHLKVLREVGLVRARREGTWVHYSVVPERLDGLTRLLASGMPSGQRVV